jgi:ribosomal protein S27E
MNANEATAQIVGYRDDLRCPGCNRNWWLFQPVQIHGSTHVRCIECKRVYSEDGSEINAG